MGNLDYKPDYRRNLPHIQPPSATFFVTFRLAGSLPSKLYAPRQLHGIVPPQLCQHALRYQPVGRHQRHRFGPALAPSE